MGVVIISGGANTLEETMLVVFGYVDSSQLNPRAQREYLTSQLL